MPKKILYIGNKSGDSGRNVTTIDTLSKLLEKEGFQVYGFSNFHNKLLRLLEMFIRTVQYRNKVDVVLIDTYSTQNFLYAIYVAKLCRLFKLPYIPILHGGNLPTRLKNDSKRSSRLFNGALTNVSPTQFLINEFEKEKYNKLAFIPNSIKLLNYPFKIRKIYKLKLLWVRSFAEIYNPKLALLVVEQLLKKDIHVELCMVGPEKDGSMKMCRKYAKENDIPVTFTGKLEKPEWIDLSKDYDLFINTTNFDNMPVSVIEAMALGLPVISTNVGGMPYLIDHDRTGILLPPNNETVFVDEIFSLIQNPKKASQLAINARKEVEKFDWEIVKEKWFKVLG